MNKLLLPSFAQRKSIEHHYFRSKRRVVTLNPLIVNSCTHLVRLLMQAYRQIFWDPVGQGTVTAWPEDCFTPLSLLHKHSEWPSTLWTDVEVKPAFRKEGRKEGRVLDAWTDGVEQFIFKKFKSALTYESLGGDENEGNVADINTADRNKVKSGWWWLERFVLFSRMKADRRVYQLLPLGGAR